MEGIGARGAAEPGWWIKFWDSAGHLDLPGGVAEEPVVSAAERDTVLQAGRAVVDRVHEMVDVAPASRYCTPGKRTPAVAEKHRAADRCRHGAGSPPYVQRFTPGAQHHRDDPRITGEPAGDVGVDRATEGQVSAADPALQDGQADGDHDLGVFPTLGGQSAVAERA